jgi:hypothetical protein
MRLLDLIAQYRKPFLIAPRAQDAQLVVMNGPSDFADTIARCPLRFVIADNLTRASAELAFADGDRLAGCLDLLGIPAPLMWVEWSDAIHQQVICQCEIVAERDSNSVGRQVGVLLQADPGGRSAMARTFWNVPSADSEVLMSPLKTYISLDERFEPHVDAEKMLLGEDASVHCADPGVADLLERVRFRFDEKWSRYYRENAVDAESRERVVRKSLAAVAHDIPLLLAFFLLLNAKGATRPVPVQRHQLNRKRSGKNRPPLLDHVEVHATLPAQSSGSNDQDAGGSISRRPPRLHQVRGHLVRRDNHVFWRTPHLRGSARQGIVRSRTVCLSFPAFVH